MRPKRLVVISLLSMTLLSSGCFAPGDETFQDADARIGATVSGAHEERLCVPDPRAEDDRVTIKLFMDLEGTGKITMTGWDGPMKVEEVSGHTKMNEAWHRGWNTGEICIDVALDADGAYAIGAYLD